MCWVGVHHGIYRSSYNISKDIIHEFTSSTILLHLSPPSIPGIVSADILFPFTYMHKKYLHHFYPSSSFPHLLPPPTSTNPSRQDMFRPPIDKFILSYSVVDYGIVPVAKEISYFLIGYCYSKTVNFF
jgi:hypothetical protein